jgi:hypothetical protein
MYADRKQDAYKQQKNSDRSKIWSSSLFIMWTVLSIFTLQGLTACTEKCEAGDPCEQSCETGLVATCVASGICECVPSDEAINPNAPSCAAPLLGQVFINEVMINPSGVEPDEEYIELVNLSEGEINLAGLVITYQGDEKLTFTGGCMTARSAVAIYDNESLWQWSTLARDVTYRKGSFRFANSNDFTFNLMDATGMIFSSFISDATLIKEGISVTRAPDGGDFIWLHNEAPGSTLDQSPAVCLNGGSFEQLCQDGVGGVPLGGTSVNPDDMCDPPMLGDLIINEVMINPSGAEPDEEFVEIVNTSDRPVAMTQVEIRYNGTQKLSFLGGCFPPRSALAAFDREDLWQWSAANGNLTYEKKSFRFNNSADFNFEMEYLTQGILLDTLSGPASLVDDGVSITRSPDLTGTISLHNEVSPTQNTQSPASCSNNGTFANQCTDGVSAGTEAGTEAGVMAGTTAGSEAGNNAGTSAGTQVNVQCNPPILGDLVINEVLGNASGSSEDQEFIEIVNTSAQAVDMNGIRLIYDSNSGMNPDAVKSITFPAGCFAASSAVAIYNNRSPNPVFEWSSPNGDSNRLSLNHAKFPITNSRDAAFTLTMASGQTLDSFMVNKSYMTATYEDQSVNRNPDTIRDAEIIPHSELISNNPQSPALCPNGTRYETGCFSL